ncbi:hypothetical protein SUGI_0846200 [Cryptomeria japonica]|uniref:polygalacturonase 1 beta-like protein 3 n=1 Tax=Cryptomeria japonica TaxID=3369 RepID=UPI002414CA27|nr:polygalacturonase 1 beta-like protein 3 [Cryptomeria japonica]GLJ40903.1 hypothetical protein SUGI_0846200 [Cryptomeria japonica]
MECRAILLGLVVCALAITTCEGGGAQPFAAKASLLRFWRRTLPNARLPPFLLDKASPLDATSVALFSGYMKNHTLSDHIASFCTAADLLCTRKTVDDQKAVSSPSDFEGYTTDKDFKNYNADGNTFTNYSDNSNVVKDDFKGYGPKSSGIQSFQNYAPGSNVVNEGFANYATDSSSALQQFTSYSDQANVIKNDFATYGKDANGILSQFTSYANNSNIITNDFKTYDQGGNGPLEQFTSYADNGNVARNDFQNYANGANGALEQFTSYAAGASEPQNLFKTYGKDGNAPSLFFTNYGKNVTGASNEFAGYNEGTNAASGSFISYAKNSTFKIYANTGPTFSDYTNTTSTGVEAGKFFRENLLVQGKTLPMPDIKDYMPKRSFLPGSLAKNLPFSTQTLPELMKTFHVPENSTMADFMARTLGDCERPAVKDEIKKCVRSVEGMAEFAVSVLGSKVEILTTESTAGSRSQVSVGAVTGKDSGKITRSVSCHQSLFPFLVYYCHAVPKVKVYQAELLSMEEKKKINNGVAICHLDTTQWSATHAAFRALGHAPGKIEVCHWIFENDLIWVPISA